ncbi:MAG TPA: DUF3455 domain-containing protein [Candidatus Acidoferrum sp.]|nr:DUF3455 domain-containing protein [Candidatus Acidoferrum sp.]
MKTGCNKKFQAGNAALRVTRGLLAGFAMLAICGLASAQERRDKQAKKEEFNFNLMAPPVTPAAITAPMGNRLFLAGHAIGSQGYVCLPLGSGVSWTVNNPRPEATLLANVFGEPAQIITHSFSHNDSPLENVVPPFGNATWQSSSDGSKVWAAPSVQTTISAGSDPSCLNSGSIPCFLLKAVGAQDGPTGGKILSRTTFIQRLKTSGGAAPSNPSTGCLAAGDVGHQILVPYQADYFFYRANE